MIDISKLSPSELDRFLHLQAIVDRQKEAQETVKALRDYYYGNHPVLLTQRQQEFLGEIVKNPGFSFAHNLVRTIVDTLRERLNVTGFTVNGEAAGDADEENAGTEAKLAAQMWSWWNANRMDSQQIRCHRRALRDGTTYAIVDYDSDNGRPRINLHKCDDGKTGVTFHRDPTDNNAVLFANRYFYTFDPLTPGTTGIARKTTYLPGEIRKYIMRGSGQWERYSDPEDNGQWPLPWVDGDGKPLGVPVIEFANPGGSEMMQVIGLQNAVNKSWLDVIAGADSSGFPIFVNEYPDGMLPPAGEDDDDIEGSDELRISPGRVIETSGHFKRLEAATLSPMLEVVWALVQAIAGVSRTPQYYLRPLGGDVPSGEALKQLESGLVQRAQERQLMFGQSWADAMNMAYKVARAFGNENIPDLGELDIATLWDDANTRNELVQSQTAEIHKRMNVPDEKIWELLGYQPDEISMFKATARLERAADIAVIAEAARTGQPSIVPQGQPQSQSGQPASADASPENLASTQGLNGIQIRAAVELLEKVTNKEIAPNIALELIVSLGVDRAKAEAMVREAGSFVAANKPQVNVTNGQTGGNTNGRAN